MAVKDKSNNGTTNKNYPNKIIIEKNNVEANIWITDVPHTSNVDKSFNFNFKPIENNKSVTPRSAIVCKPLGTSKPAKLYANPATKNPTIGGRPIRLIKIPKKKANVTSVIIIK